MQDDAANTPGRRWFIAGAVVLLLLGSIHLLAVAQSLGPAPDLEKLSGGARAFAELDIAAKAARQRLGPFEFCAWGLIEILSCSYSILVLGAGITNLVVWRPVAAAGKLRQLTIVNVFMTGALAGVTAIWQFPPPLVIALVAMMCFIASFVRQK